MDFSIHMGIPEMLELWMRLHKESMDGSISKSDANLYKKWGKALKLLSGNPFYPSLHTHEIQDLTRRYGQKVWQSYLENRTSRRHANVLGVWPRAERYYHHRIGTPSRR